MGLKKNFKSKNLGCISVYTYFNNYVTINSVKHYQYQC